MSKKKKGIILTISIAAIILVVMFILLFINRPVLDVKENIMVEVGGRLSQDDSDPITDLDDTVEPNEATEFPVKKEFTFSSAEEVENISDEDLIMIVTGGYTREDFFEKEEYAYVDLFDLPLMVPTEEEPENRNEQIRIEILDMRDIGEDQDINTPISIDFIKEYSVAHIEECFETWNTRTSGYETGTLVQDEEIIFCGENDFYVEYSGRYTDSRNIYSNNVLETNNIPRAYRFVFMRTLAHKANENGRVYVILGELSKEYVQEQMDYYIYEELGTLIYRETIEEEDCYIYNTYYVIHGHGDFGINDSASLYKDCYTINKETHELSSDTYNQIKDIEIEGTAQDWPEEW